MIMTSSISRAHHSMLAGFTMNSVRYHGALIALVILPPLLLFWPLIHPFVSFWRKVGPVWTYSLIGGLMAGGITGLFLVRKPLLSVEFGTNFPLILIGALFLAVSVWLGLILQRHITTRTILGLPELAMDHHPGRLIREGLYTRVRHPRYLQVAMALLGYALIVNYLAIYIAVALWLPGIYVIVVLEEKELRDRFGGAYEEYCQKVPRFIPRFTRNPQDRPKD